MGMSFAVVSLAGAAVACQPSRHQVRYEGYLQTQRFVRMVFTGQVDASRSHFTDDLSVGVRTQRHKGSHVGEGSEVSILAGL